MTPEVEFVGGNCGDNFATARALWLQEYVLTGTSDIRYGPCPPGQSYG